VTERMVTRKEMAQIAAVSVTTIDRFIREGMPHAKYGPRMVRLKPSLCLPWMDNRMGPNPVDHPVQSLSTSASGRDTSKGDTDG
jgi:hypothetical protein